MIYIVSKVVYVCSGSIKIKVLGMSFALATASFPPALHPALAAVGICQAQTQIEIYDPARLEAAKARIREIGPGAKLESCRGSTCKIIPTEWTQTLKIGG